MTAANPYIRAYQTQQEQTLIVSGETSWDITPAVGLRSIIHFMLDIAAGNTDDWPLRPAHGPPERGPSPKRSTTPPGRSP